MARKQFNAGRVRAKRFTPAGRTVHDQQRHRRPRNARARRNRNPLYNPSAPLKGNDLYRASRALTQAELGPQLSALRGERQDVSRQGFALVTRANRLYQAMAAREGAAVAQQKELQARVGQQVQAANQQGAQAIQNLAGQANAAVDEAQARTGVDVGAKGQIAAEQFAAGVNQAGDARRASSDAALQSGNYQGLFGAMGRARQLQGGETRRELLNRLQNTRYRIDKDIGNLRSQRGALNLKNLTALRQQGFENIATVAGLGLKRADLEAQMRTDAENRKLARDKLKATDKENRAQRRLAGRRIGATIRGQNVTKRGQNIGHGDRQRALDLQRWKANHPGKTRNKESQSSHNLKADIDDARSSIRRYRARGLHGPQITRRARKAKIRPLVLNVARDLEFLGYVSGTNIAALRRAGVRIPRAWLRHHNNRGKKSARAAARAISGFDLGI